MKCFIGIYNEEVFLVVVDEVHFQAVDAFVHKHIQFSRIPGVNDLQIAIYEYEMQSLHRLIESYGNMEFNIRIVHNPQYFQRS